MSSGGQEIGWHDLYVVRVVFRELLLWRIAGRKPRRKKYRNGVQFAHMPTPLARLRMRFHTGFRVSHSESRTSRPQLKQHTCGIDGNLNQNDVASPHMAILFSIVVASSRMAEANQSELPVRAGLMAAKPNRKSCYETLIPPSSNQSDRTTTRGRVYCPFSAAAGPCT